MTISINIHNSYRSVVAICDFELIGKRFEKGKFQLDIKEDFFKGNEVSKEKAIEVIKDLSCEDATFFIVGKESVESGLKAGVIFNESVGEIDNIPFAMVLL